MSTPDVNELARKIADDVGRLPRTIATLAEIQRVIASHLAPLVQERDILAIERDTTNKHFLQAIATVGQLRAENERLREIINMVNDCHLHSWNICSCACKNAMEDALATPEGKAPGPS